MIVCQDKQPLLQKMKDTLRQLAVVITTILTLVINGLANALPINGKTTAQISDSFKVYFVPAGYVFSIWGVIYIGLIAYTIYQALPAQKNNPRLRAIGWWMALGNVANAIWIFMWHYLQIPITVLLIGTLLVSLIAVYVRLNTGETVSSGERWAVRLPISIYLGWATVATVANITSCLYFLNWDGFEIAPEIWMTIVLGAVLLIATIMNFIRRDIAYTAVILWALAGIAVKHAAVSAVVLPTWITFALVALTITVAVVLRKPSQKSVLTR